jgi:flagellar biosynthesis protein FlhF
MKPRTFRATSTQLALEQVQNELGSEAIILSVRQVPAGPAWQTWKRPEVEVLAVSPSDGLAGSNVTRANEPAPHFETFSDEDFVSKTGAASMSGDNPDQALMTSKKELESYLAQLTTRIAQEKASARNLQKPRQESVTTQKAEPGSLTHNSGVPPVLIQVKAHLEKQGLDREIVKRVLTTCGESLGQSVLQDEERVRKYILQQMAAFTKKARTDLLEASASRRVLCLIGSSGAGKTSTCAKIAAHFSKALDQKVTWVCADTVRTGAIQLARSYTNSLGLPLALAYTPDELARAINTQVNSGLVLIDMPACNPYSKDEVIHLGEFLTAISDRETYLALPASTKEMDMEEALAALTPFNLSGLIVTKLDETGYFGSIYNIAWRSQIPVAAFTDGTDVMKNLHVAGEKDLASLLFGMPPGRADVPSAMK